MTTTLDLWRTLSGELADAVGRVGTTLVQVHARPRRPATGTVFAPDLVLAADHAVERDEDVAVRLVGGGTLPATVAGRDPATDVAVLRVPGLGAPAARPAADPPRVGALALAVARPGGDQVMATLGVVSGVGGPWRTGGGAVLEHLIQTTAPTYPGFSGGPLVGPDGAVLGLLTSGLGRGAALAIPAATAWQIGEALARDGQIRRGYLGVGTQPVRLPASLRERAGAEHGLVVVEVVEGSPAARAGLLLGDVILALNGHPVADIEDLQALLGGERVGTAVEVGIVRAGEPRSLAATVGERGRPPA